MNYQELIDAIDAKWYILQKKEEFSMMEYELHKKLSRLRLCAVENHMLTQKQIIEAMLAINDVLPKHLTHRGYAARVSKALHFVNTNCSAMGPSAIASTIGITSQRMNNLLRQFENNKNKVA